MVRASNFAEFVAQLSADDAELQKDLKSAETATKASATRMQTSLNKVNISAGNLSGVLGTVSQAGAAVGGTFGGITGQAVAAAQAMAQMSAVISGPVGIIAGLVALTVGVVAYREEAAGWLNSMLQTIGILEDLDAALAKAEGRLAAQELRLQKQVDAQARLNNELRDQNQLLTAVRTKDPEAISQAQRDIALRKRVEQERRGGSGEEAIKVLSQIAAANDKIRATKAVQAEIDGRIAEHQKEKLRNLTIEKQRLAEIATIEKTRVAAAQQLLIGIGAAKPSEFISDPVLRRLAQLGETLAGGQQAPAGAQGTFGLRRISAPSGALRVGQQIGAQTLNTAEKNKEINAETLRVTKEVRDILGRISTNTASSTMSGPLQTTGAP